MGLNGNVPETYGAIRVGKYKLIEGVAGRGDWMGADPAAAWGQGANDMYIMGPDVTDYDMIDAGGRLGDMKMGDGGQAAVKRGGFAADAEKFASVVKSTWLFDMEADPTEHHDLSAAMPEKVEELSRELDLERQNMASPIILEARGDRYIARSEVTAVPDGSGRTVVGLWADAPERAGDGGLEEVLFHQNKPKGGARL